MACLPAATGLIAALLGQRSFGEPFDLSWSLRNGILWETIGLHGVEKAPSSLKVQASKRKLWREEALVKQKVSNRARLVIRELRGGSAEDGSVWEILRRWVRGMTPRRRDWLDLLIEFDNEADRELYFKVFNFALDEGSFEACARDYTKIIDKYGKLQRLDEAESTLKEMKQLGFAADTVTYTVLISLFGRLGMVDRAREAFDEIKQAGLEPDSRAVMALMVAYGLAGMPEEAESVLLASPELMTSEALTALICAYGRARGAGDAERVFNLMQVNGLRPNLKAFTALIDAYTKVGHLEGAVKTFQLLLDVGLVPDDRLICRMIMAYEKGAAIELAVKLLADLEKSAIRAGPDSLSTLIGYFGRAGKIEEAEVVYSEYMSRGFRLTHRAATNMYYVYARSGQLEKARDMLRLMKENRLEVDEAAYNRFIQGLLCGNLCSEAKIMYQKMVDNGWELSESVKASLTESLQVMA